ncbi:hypothetical protein [Bovine papular stomatitis virus]
MAIVVGLVIAAAAVFGALGLCTLGLEAYVAFAEHRMYARREEELEELMLQDEGEFVNY